MLGVVAHVHRLSQKLRVSGLTSLPPPLISYSPSPLPPISNFPPFLQHSGASWKALFLGDLMAPDRVKFHYRKAMLLLHPDKNVNGSVEQRFIAEKVRTRVGQCLQGLDSLVMCLTRLYMCLCVAGFYVRQRRLPKLRRPGVEVISEQTGPIL